MSTDLSVIVTALVRPHMEARVVNALHDLPEFPGFFITRVRWQGRGRGAGGEYVSTESDLSYHEFIKLEIVCGATSAEAISSKIVEAAWTGRKGDGVLFSGPVHGFGRIRELGASKREESA
jgi:nitrogen regulatory protein P-II 1